jgi:hypothetical protein
MASTGSLGRLAGGHHAGRVDAGEVVGDDVPGALEPEIGHAGEHLALAGNRGGQHHVEGGQAIGGQEQHLAVVEGVDVAHLAALD